MQNEPIVSYGVPLGAEPILPHTKAHAATASREAAQRDMEYLKALNRSGGQTTNEPPRSTTRLSSADSRSMEINFSRSAKRGSNSCWNWITRRETASVSALLS